MYVFPRNSDAQLNTTILCHTEILLLPSRFLYAHRRTTSHLPRGGEGNPGGSSPFFPFLLRIRVRPGPRVLKARAVGAPAGGGHRVRAHTTALAPRTPDEPRSPRSARAGSAQPGASLPPGPPPPATEGSARSPRHRPLILLTDPSGPFKGKAPVLSTPKLAPPRIRGEWEEASGLTDAWLCLQTYRAL